MCFVWLSEQTATFVPHNINWLVLTTEMKSVYCVVRIVPLNKTLYTTSLKGKWLSLSATSNDTISERSDCKLRHTKWSYPSRFRASAEMLMWSAHFWGQNQQQRLHKQSISRVRSETGTSWIRKCATHKPDLSSNTVQPLRQPPCLPNITLRIRSKF
jgi:hypothetical protein